MVHMTDRTPQSAEFEPDLDGASEVDVSNDDNGNDSFAPPLQTGEGEIMGPALSILPENISRGDTIRYLSKDIPSNQYGMPEFFFRSDMINPASGMFGPEELDAASVPLFYHEGYPTLESGQAFWNQLPHEPHEAFLLFRRYIDQAEETGIRQLELLALTENVQLEYIRQMFLEFYWSVRSRAHDLFIVAAEQKKRQFRTRKMENTHFEKAQALLDKLATKFKDDDWLDELNAKEAIEALDLLAKLQRLSMGLTGMNASSIPKNQLPEGASTQQLLEHLTRGTSAAGSNTSSFAARLEQLLDDPEQGLLLQAAIIKVNGTSDVSAPSGAYIEE